MASAYDYNTEQSSLVNFYNYLRSALLGHRYNAHKLAIVQTRISWVDWIAALTSSGAIISLTLWSTNLGSIVFKALLTLSAVAAITRTVFGWSRELELRSRLSYAWNDLYLDMEAVVTGIRAHEHISEEDRAKMDLLSERFRKLNSLDPGKTDAALMLKLQDQIEQSIPAEGLWLPA